MKQNEMITHANIATRKGDIPGIICGKRGMIPAAFRNLQTEDRRAEESGNFASGSRKAQLKQSERTHGVQDPVFQSVLPKRADDASKNAMMQISGNVGRIFTHLADEFFALDAMQRACESCAVEVARFLCSNVPQEPAVPEHTQPGHATRS